MLVGAAARADANILIEGWYLGMPIRLESGSDQGLVDVTYGGTEYQIDLRAAPAVLPTVRYELTYWGGRRLLIAHEKGSYFVLSRHGRTCGEVVAATWTRALIQPLVSAMDVLQQREPAATSADSDECGTLPFHSLASRGWPLLASRRDTVIFRTSRIDTEFGPVSLSTRAPGSAR